MLSQRDCEYADHIKHLMGASITMRWRPSGFSQESEENLPLISVSNDHFSHNIVTYLSSWSSIFCCYNQKNSISCVYGLVADNILTNYKMQLLIILKYNAMFLLNIFPSISLSNRNLKGTLNNENIVLGIILSQCHTDVSLLIFDQNLPSYIFQIHITQLD